MHGAEPRSEPVPWRQWGDDIDDASRRQMENACRLPVARRGALMPDAHVGYGLPIGGVLATENAVVPYAVGVDIACRVCMTVYDDEVDRDPLVEALEQETAFGIGAEFGVERRREHEVLDDPLWHQLPVLGRERERAARQLGSSGSGNHFVEWGTFEPSAEEARRLGLAADRRFLALLSHSGSRGPGAAVARHYTQLAKRVQDHLPREMRDLAWLDLDTGEGDEYWQAMTLMGRYASANHDRIHHHVAGRIGIEPLLKIENHHNFAWREEHEGHEWIVHRKGATPAGRGELGLVPGTMADPTYLVRGRGNPASLSSSSHGAGRRMSRTAARKAFTWEETRALLAERGVELLSAGLDEAPMAYKSIDEVLRAQADLVDVVGSFRPRLVKMAPGNEPPED